MKRLTPRLRLVLWAPGIAASLAATLLFAALVRPLVRDSAGHTLLASLDLLGPLVAERAELPQPELQAWVADFAGGAELRLTVIARSGTVLADSSVAAAAIPALESHGTRPEVIQAMAGGSGTDVRRSATTGESFVYAARAVSGRGGRLVVVRLARPLRRLDELRGDLAWMMLATLVGSAVAAAGVGLWLRRRVLVPFARLVAGAERLAVGIPGERVPEPDVEELSVLSRSLNRLAGRVEDQIAVADRERRQLQEILDGMGEGVLVTGGTGRPIYANASFREQFGVPAAAATAEVLELVRNVRLNEILAGALAGSRGGEGEGELRIGERVLAVSGRPLEALGGALLVVRDVTGATRLARMRREFVANVSHELKTPLAVIRGAAETLQDAGAGDEALVERFALRIVEQCYRLEDLLKDLLTLSRLESPEALAQRRPTDLLALAARAVEVMQPVASRQQVRISAQLSAVPAISGDGPALERLVLNLLHNAIQYNRPGGEVRVRLRPGGERTIELEVADDGVGIPAAELPRIFERFYRVDKGRGRSEGGSGLGLAIVKHVAQAHGGRVEVESTPGAGSVFRVELPARDPSVQLGAAAGGAGRDDR